jgi:hypothetical protein
MGDKGSALSAELQECGGRVCCWSRRVCCHAQRMIVLELDVNRVQLGSFSSFALMSSLCFSWKVLAIFAMKGEFWRCHHGDSLLVSSWV